MKSSLRFLLFLLASGSPIFAEEITLTSKDGRKIDVTLIQVYGDSVEVRKKGGDEFKIDFEKLDDATVKDLKKIALEEKEAAIAAQKDKVAAKEAELARIPKFPKNPKSLTDLPEKIVITPEDSKKTFFKLDQVNSFFVAPTESPEPAASDATLSVSTAFGGGKIMTVISHNLTSENLSMKLIARTDNDAEFPEPITLSVPSKIAKSVNGAATAGYFSKLLDEDVSEIILYDFQVAP